MIERDLHTEARERTEEVRGAVRLALAVGVVIGGFFAAAVFVAIVTF